MKKFIISMVALTLIVGAKTLSCESIDRDEYSRLVNEFKQNLNLKPYVSPSDLNDKKSQLIKSENSNISYNSKALKKCANVIALRDSIVVDDKRYLALLNLQKLKSFMTQAEKNLYSGAIIESEEYFKPYDGASFILKNIKNKPLVFVAIAKDKSKRLHIYEFRRVNGLIKKFHITINSKKPKFKSGNLTKKRSLINYLNSVYNTKIALNGNKKEKIMAREQFDKIDIKDDESYTIHKSDVSSATKVKTKKQIRANGYKNSKSIVIPKGATIEYENYTYDKEYVIVEYKGKEWLIPEVEFSKIGGW